MHEKRKLLVFDDNGSSLKVTDILRKSYDCYITQLWTDVFGWLALEPGGDAFTALILDLHVPAVDMPKIIGKDAYNEEKHQSPSLYFVNEYLKYKYPHLVKNVIWLSAYLHNYDKVALGDITAINKYDPDYIDTLLDEIKKRES